MVTPFTKIGIVGVGLIGGSFGMAAKRYRIASEVVGIGRNPAKLERAKELSAIDSWSLDMHEALSDADLVYLSTPVANVIDTLKQLNSLKPGCIVTDAGSTKKEICDAANSYLPQDVRFVGGHPMTGSEFTGVEYAAPDIFKGAAYILTPDSKSDDLSIARMRTVVEMLGSRLVELDPISHDRCVSVISHLPHIIAASLIKLAESYSRENPHIFDIISGSFRDMTRVAGSSPEIWRDICATNSDNIREAVSLFSKYLDEGASLASSNRASEFEKWFEQSKMIKDSRMPNE